MTDLNGKTALITGSTSGIGRSTAIAWASRGAYVLIVGRDEQRAKDVVAEIEGKGGSATFRLTMLSDLASAQGVVDWATDASDGHVDILITNAGVADLRPSNAVTEEQFDGTFAVNVKFRSSWSRPSRRPWPSADGVRSSTSPPWSPASDSPAWLCTARAAQRSNS